MAGEEEWLEKNTEILKAKGKTMDINTAQDTRASSNSLGTPLVRK